MLELEKRLENIGRAVIAEFALHSSKQISVTITQSAALSYLIVTVGAHPVAMFKIEEVDYDQENHNANKS